MMNRNVKILDCTLRDGGRVIDCAFPQFHIDGIACGLTDAGIDIIELGFLRSGVNHSGNSTFFSKIEQARNCVPLNKGNTQYVLFADYGEEFGGWDFNNLPQCDGETITGIRLGFRKADFAAARETMHIIQNRGYNLILQMIETRNYSDMELVQTLMEMNTIKPKAVGLVDTFGRMYKDDLQRIYTLADHNLDDEITIDFHSHNNMQLSFSFAQEIVAMSKGKRNVILDATLIGMGKGAGNLNTELIVEYLNSRYGYTYDYDRILDTIEEHILWIKKEHDWGYSVPSLMSGLFSAHPNNVDYLLRKNRLQIKDIRYILSMIDPETRKRYDYDNIERIYHKLYSTKYDDTNNLKLLKEIISDRSVLVIVFGATSRDYSETIVKHIKENEPIVISINYIYPDHLPDFVFYGNQRRYKNKLPYDTNTRCIITSNINSCDDSDIIVDYSKVISVGCPNYDNTTIMLLNLMRNIGVENITLAGFDGYSKEISDTYSDKVISHSSPHQKDYEVSNEELKILLKNFAGSIVNKRSIKFLTPSRFQTIFRD